MSPDSERFHGLRPLRVGDFSDLALGHKVGLLMLHYLPTGSGAIFPVEFIPRELEYRTPGQKDAVLHGSARLSDGEDGFEPARILFSQYHKTASLKGLVLEGNVKRSP